MRNATVVFCLMIGSLIPFCLRQQQSTAAPPAQNPPANSHPQTNPIPDKFVNLQVLPKDITKPKLVNMMKQFSITFAVRCSYCHTVSDDLTEGSFDSDEKPTKLKAREMIRAILELNNSSPSR